MIHLQPPNKTSIHHHKVFLAGSIEMDKAERWQDTVVNSLSDYDIVVANPRRDDWDPNITQSKDDPRFSEQVNWELNNIETSQIVFFYFQPGTVSPISLLELGMVLGQNQRGQEVIVCCPPGYFRKGNVDIICERYGVRVFDDLHKAVTKLKQYVHYMIGG
jgi:hypothetical protein